MHVHQTSTEKQRRIQRSTRKEFTLSEIRVAMAFVRAGEIVVVVGNRTIRLVDEDEDNKVIVEGTSKPKIKSIEEE